MLDVQLDVQLDSRRMRSPSVRKPKDFQDSVKPKTPGENQNGGKQNNLEREICIMGYVFGSSREILYARGFSTACLSKVNC